MKPADPSNGNTTGRPSGWLLREKIAAGAAIFALLLSIVIILNFIQVRRSAPLDTPLMRSLVSRLQADPADEQLRQEIRELDLLSRRAFFTSRWQVRMGGYLLAASLLLIIICLKSIELQQKPLPGRPGEKRAGVWNERATGRRWIFYTGGAVVLLALVLIVLSHLEPSSYLASDKQEASLKGAKSEAGSAESRVQQAAGDTVPPDTATVDGSGVQPGAAPAGGFASEQEMAQNFPAFRGAGGTGISGHKKLPADWNGREGKNIRWKTAVPLPGYNSPIIWNDRVFLTGASEKSREVYCFSLADGKILWRKSVTVEGGQVPKVSKETGFSAPTMATDGRRVYAIFANGDISAFDMEGNSLWQKNLGVPQNHYGYSSSLITFRDLVIVQYDNRNSPSVMALEGSSGKLAWQTPRNVKISWASPVLINVEGRPQLVLAAEPDVIAYDPSNGKEIWQIGCIAGEVGPSPAYAGGIVFTVNDYSKLAAIRVGASVELLWEDSEYLSDIPSPVADDKNLYLVTSYGMTVCYDSKTGTRHWEHEFGTPVFASPVIAEGKVYILDKKGVMHILKADRSYSVVGEPQLGEGSCCTPAFADGLIVIRGDKNLYCIGK